jgi:hypothetical protein
MIEAKNLSTPTSFCKRAGTMLLRRRRQGLLIQYRAELRRVGEAERISQLGGLIGVYLDAAGPGSLAFSFGGIWGRAGLDHDCRCVGGLTE